MNKKDARKAGKEIDDAEDPGTVNTFVAQNWFRCLKEGDTSFKDKPKSKRPSFVEDDALLEMVKQQPSTSICTLSFLKPHQSINSISLTLWTDIEIAWNIAKLLTHPSNLKHYLLCAVLDVYTWFPK